MNKDIQEYHNALSDEDKTIAEKLHELICSSLPKAESKVWHRHPVWFLEGNPIVGYHRLKKDMRLMFWSGGSFEEEGLTSEGKFKAGVVHYSSVDQINTKDLKRWLKKSKDIQWDYKNIVKRKGVLERLK